MPAGAGAGYPGRDWLDLLKPGAAPDAGFDGEPEGALLVADISLVGGINSSSGA